MLFRQHSYVQHRLPPLVFRVEVRHVANVTRFQEMETAPRQSTSRPPLVTRSAQSRWPNAKMRAIWPPEDATFPNTTTAGNHCAKWPTPIHDGRVKYFINRPYSLEDRESSHPWGTWAGGFHVPRSRALRVSCLLSRTGFCSVFQIPTQRRRQKSGRPKNSTKL